jgi:hypothetical protein
MLTLVQGYRDRWWPTLWFYPYAEKLLAWKNNTSITSDPSVFAVVDGTPWAGANTSYDFAESDRSVGGGWTDQGLHIDWHSLCGEWENDLYSKKSS